MGAYSSLPRTICFPLRIMLPAAVETVFSSPVSSSTVVSLSAVPMMMCCPSASRVPKLFCSSIGTTLLSMASSMYDIISFAVSPAFAIMICLPMRESVEFVLPTTTCSAEVLVVPKFTEPDVISMDFATSLMYVSSVLVSPEPSLTCSTVPLSERIESALPTVTMFSVVVVPNFEALAVSISSPTTDCMYVLRSIGLSPLFCTMISLPVSLSPELVLPTLTYVDSVVVPKFDAVSHETVPPPPAAWLAYSASDIVAPSFLTKILV